MSETSDSEIRLVQTASDSSRLLRSRWTSTELDFGLSAFDGLDSLPSRFPKSVDFHLSIADKHGFKRFIYVAIILVFVVVASILLLHFLNHKQQNGAASKDLTLALRQALLFFDAQKSGDLPENFPIRFRGDSGLDDGKDGDMNADLVGGFYDSGNNIKFSFTTAYTVTLLSWTVVEYHRKYEDVGELDHVKDVIKWGSDYLLKLFVPPSNPASDSSVILYSQVGDGNRSDRENDATCWQRPEDMKYPRPVSVCDETAADLAGEIVAAMSAASLVFAGDKTYARRLIDAAEAFFGLVISPDKKLGKYTENEACGGRARAYYNSTGYIDELVWGATWLFFATGKTDYLKYATDNFVFAEEEELPSEEGIFYWNNKLTANALLMTRIRYFIDLGYPYEDALSTNRTDLLVCSYLSLNRKRGATNGGLIVLTPDGGGAPLQYAATAAFLSKLYGDYIQLLKRTSGSCGGSVFSVQMLQDFSLSQVNYILGDNPKKMSYLVGYGDRYPGFAHHRGASIPWDEKKRSCSEGGQYLNSKYKNPNDLVGAMVGGPDKNDVFLDDRNRPWFTQPSISSNAGLVSALVALHDPPAAKNSSDSDDGATLGIDKMGLYQNVHLR
ncbi:endoglucanase 25-like [Andrographis paniculata]|uniref:endoglucanase 25-like n=1 Tax=Andrographis paniculata TaxID=175694 RepID=UPI0021E911C4|nr:endoglucanase 25-like [Andrographis paniculata]